MWFNIADDKNVGFWLYSTENKKFFGTTITGEFAIDKRPPTTPRAQNRVLKPNLDRISYSCHDTFATCLFDNICALSSARVAPGRRWVTGRYWGWSQTTHMPEHASEDPLWRIFGLFPAWRWQLLEFYHVVVMNLCYYGSHNCTCRHWKLALCRKGSFLAHYFYTSTCEEWYSSSPTCFLYAFVSFFLMD